MNVRGLSKLSSCSTLITGRNPVASTCRLTNTRSCIPQQTVASISLQISRGAKTKTVVKAKDLPQGLLPPLPKDETQESIPAKQYSSTLQGHLNNMRKFPSCVILTRIGDFYELYFDQVETYAPLLGLKKAKRRTVLGDVPMAGFQHWTLEKYLKVLVRDHGLKVAISEQIRPSNGDDESISSGKNGNMYERRVTRVITPGTLIDESFVDPLECSYLLAVHFDFAAAAATEAGHDTVHGLYDRSAKVGLSWIDSSSGEFFTQAADVASLPSLVARIGPREVVLDQSMESIGQADLQKALGDGSYPIEFHSVISATSSVAEWTSMLERPIPDSKHHEFTKSEIAAGNIALDYVCEKLQDMQQIRLQPPIRRSDEEYMTIDKQSLRGLEIRSLIRDGTFQGSLLHTIRRTVTKSGARLLSQRLVSPSMNLSVINDRLDFVQEMLEHDALREDILALLGGASDTCRLLQKFSINKGDADDLLGLARTVDIMTQVSKVLHDHILETQDSDDARCECFWDVLERIDLDGPGKVAKAILDAIDEDSLTRQHTLEVEGREETEEMAEEVVSADTAGEKGPKLARRGAKMKNAATAVSSTMDSMEEDIWIMHSNASPTLERAHHDLRSLFNTKQELTQKLRKELRAESLTLKWTSKAGHFCLLKSKDVRADISALAGARNIQTTKTTRMFNLDEWTQLGVQIDNIKLRIRTEEERVFGKLRGQVIENLMTLRRNAAVLDELDVACSSAIVARERNFVRPIINNSTSHNIIGGRHPTVDVGLKEQGRLFTANDCSVGDDEKILLITGPNMAGKSTFLRQNALITILAQTGCFVPAAYAEIGLVDKIFSRVGSADNLYQDQSTFMVEMLETAEILKQATPRSFVIMDEVGRGTTPEDGIAVGYACLHHLRHVNKCRCLFATHFHALADMTRGFGKLGYWCTDVAELGDGGKEWMYVHKLRPGVNRKSHALKVAELAGMPEDAVAEAARVLADIQMERASEAVSESQQSSPMGAAG